MSEGLRLRRNFRECDDRALGELGSGACDAIVIPIEADAVAGLEGEDGGADGGRDF